MASTSRNGSPLDSKALVCVPRHSPPAATIALRFDGIISGGFSYGRKPSWLSTMRFSPLTGLMAIAPNSFQKRFAPVVRGLRTSQAVRWSISPSAIPPSVVLMKSFSDGWLVSPKYSQVVLPKAATAADS